MAKKNGIATADDFRKAMEFEDPEPVMLPKLGKPVLLRRPSPMWLMYRGRLAVTLASKLAGVGKNNDTDDATAMFAWILEVVQAVMVQPRCVADPKPGEISPDMLNMDDALFITRWAAGEEVDGANSLSTFRGERGTPNAGEPG